MTAWCGDMEQSLELQHIQSWWPSRSINKLFRRISIIAPVLTTGIHKDRKVSEYLQKHNQGTMLPHWHSSHTYGPWMEQSAFPDHMLNGHGVNPGTIIVSPRPEALSRCRQTPCGSWLWLHHEFMTKAGHKAGQ